ncbi:MAG: hypothetical protein Q9227_002964 [Pyrenula ochraceoflavens]
MAKRSLSQSQQASSEPGAPRLEEHRSKRQLGSSPKPNVELQHQGRTKDDLRSGTPTRLGSLRDDHQHFVILSWNVSTIRPYLDVIESKDCRPLTNPSSDIRQYFGRPSIRPVSPPPLRRQEANPKGWSPFYALVGTHSFPHVICLQELSIHISDLESINSLHHALIPDKSVRDMLSAETGIYHPAYTVHATLCRSRVGRGRFGVATLVREDVVLKESRDVDWDAEGRVRIVMFALPPSVPASRGSVHGRNASDRMKGSSVALLNVYALNGTSYPYRNPVTNTLHGTRNERKREFNRLLAKECQALRDQGYKVLLIGDFNIALSAKDTYPRLRTEEPHARARQEFQDLFLKNMGMRDVFRDKEPETRVGSWFASAQDWSRVDYALMDSALAERVKAVRYLVEKKEKSDHCPMEIEMT